MVPKDKSEAKIFEDYGKKRWKLFKRNFKEYLKNKEQESLHRARVEVKKTVALLHFVHFCDKEFKDRKRLKPYRKFLEATGKLRDTYNARLLAERFHFKKQVKEPEIDPRDYEPVFQKIKDSHRKTTDGFNNRMTLVQLKKFISVLIKDIHSSIAAGLRAETLHETRKKMKDAIYLYDLLSKTNKSATAVSTADIKMLDRLQDLIGNWHDLIKFRGGIEKMKDAPDSRRLILEVQLEEEKRLEEILKLSKQV